MGTSVVWRIIDTLSGKSLAERAEEVQEVLRLSDDDVLIDYFNEAAGLYGSLFSRIFSTLYFTVFEGWANESGLIDFASNIVLSGSAVYGSILADPDNFSEIDGGTEFGEDPGVNVVEMASRILETRHGTVKAEKMIAKKVGRGVLLRPTVWELLRKDGVSRPYTPDPEYARAHLPRIFRKRSSGGI